MICEDCGIETSTQHNRHGSNAACKDALVHRFLNLPDGLDIPDSKVIQGGHVLPLVLDQRLDKLVDEVANLRSYKSMYTEMTSLIEELLETARIPTEHAVGFELTTRDRINLTFARLIEYEQRVGDAIVGMSEGLVVVNTNATHRTDAWRDMLEQSKASAYQSRKTAVCFIPAGFPIALYHTGVGIIAFGKTTETFRRKPDGNDPEGEYYIPCEFETTINPITEPQNAITAREINAFLGAKHHFRLTAFSLPEKTVNFVREKLREKSAGIKS